MFRNGKNKALSFAHMRYSELKLGWYKCRRRAPKAGGAPQAGRHLHDRPRADPFQRGEGASCTTLSLRTKTTPAGGKETTPTTTRTREKGGNKSEKHTYHVLGFGLLSTQPAEQRKRQTGARRGLNCGTHTKQKKKREPNKIRSARQTQNPFSSPGLGRRA